MQNVPTQARFLPIRPVTLCCGSMCTVGKETFTRRTHVEYKRLHVNEVSITVTVGIAQSVLMNMHFCYKSMVCCNF